MKRIKILVLALMTVGVAVFAVAPSALASGPTLLFLNAREPGPTVLFNPSTRVIRGELQSRLAEIKSTELALEVTLLPTREGVKGIYLVKFFHSVLTATAAKCTNDGVEGEISIFPTRSELAELVYVSLVPLRVGILFLVGTREELRIECGTLRLKVKGTALALLEKLETVYKAGENTIEGTLAGTRGVPTLKTFWSFRGEELTANLRVTVGGETEEGAEVAEEGRPVKILATREIKVDG